MYKRLIYNQMNLSLQLLFWLVNRQIHWIQDLKVKRVQNTLSPSVHVFIISRHQISTIVWLRMTNEHTKIVAANVASHLAASVLSFSFQKEMFYSLISSLQMWTLFTRRLIAPFNSSRWFYVLTLIEVIVRGTDLWPWSMANT